MIEIHICTRSLILTNDEYMKIFAQNYAAYRARYRRERLDRKETLEIPVKESGLNSEATKQRACERIKEKDLTDKNLANQLGITVQAVNKWKHKGKSCVLENLYGLSGLLGVRVDEFLVPNVVHKEDVIVEYFIPRVQEDREAHAENLNHAGVPSDRGIVRTNSSIHSLSGLDMEATKQRVLERIKEKGFTDKTLANQLGITVQAVNKWKHKGKSISLENLYVLSGLLGVRVNELLVPRVVRKENVIVESSTLKDQEEEGSNI